MDQMMHAVGDSGSCFASLYSPNSKSSRVVLPHSFSLCILRRLSINDVTLSVRIFPYCL